MKYGGGHYYSPEWEHEENIEKYELMRCYKVKIGKIENKGIKSGEVKDYKGYYEEALKRIIGLM